MKTNGTVSASGHGVLQKVSGLAVTALLSHSITFGADTYTIDPADRSITFSVRHFGIARITESITAKFWRRA